MGWPGLRRCPGPGARRHGGPPDQPAGGRGGPGARGIIALEGMSLSLARRAASVLVAAYGVAAAGLTGVAGDSDNTWAPTGAFAEKLDSPVFALAVDPADGRRTLAGTASGTIYL